MKARLSKFHPLGPVYEYQTEINAPTKVMSGAATRIPCDTIVIPLCHMCPCIILRYNIIY